MNKYDKNYEVRADGEAKLNADNGRMVEGYASVFNRLSNPLIGFVNDKMVTFREMILTGAFDGLIDTQDITANFNHREDNGILARSKNGVGTLSLTIDESGLKYSFECPETTLGNDMLQYLKRGDIDSSSFAFSVAQNGDKWEKQTDGTYVRKISKMGCLYDVSMIIRPAYNDAKVSLRSLEEIEEIEKQKQELDNYFNQLKAEYV